MNLIGAPNNQTDQKFLKLYPREELEIHQKLIVLELSNPMVSQKRVRKILLISRRVQTWACPAERPKEKELLGDQSIDLLAAQRIEQVEKLSSAIGHTT